MAYSAKADRIIALLVGLKKKGRFNRRSHFDFVKKLERLLEREDMFEEIGVNRNVSLRDVMGNGDDSITRYWADIFELNFKQWELLELVNEKKPQGVIVQHITDLGTGVKNWLKGIERYNIDMSGIKMAL